MSEPNFGLYFSLGLIIGLLVVIIIHLNSIFALLRGVL